jgi:hypothetical protein
VSRVIVVNPSVGTPSMIVETAGAIDYDVTLTIGGSDIECTVTLIPDEYDGRLSS